MRDEDERRAEERARFRSGNERLRRVMSSYRFGPGDAAPFICECPDPGCYESVMLSLEEYDRVRANPRWFLLAAGHEDDEARDETIVESERGFSIVEVAEARSVADASRPRRCV